MDANDDWRISRNKYMKTVIIFLLFTMMAFTYAFNCQDYSITNKTGSSGDKKPIPEAPSNLVAITVSSSQINLSWKDNSRVEDGFKLERSTDGINYAILSTLNANTISYSDTGLTDGTIYYYRVCAYNKRGISDYSNVAFSTIALNAPTSLSITVISSSQLNLSWTDNSGAESGYKIERKTGSDGIYAQINTVEANVTFYPNTGLTDGTTYYYRVCAYNTNGDSAYSNDASTAISLNAPTNLITTTVTSSQISLQWSDNSGNESGFKIERKLGIGGTYTQIATTIIDMVTYNDNTVTPSNIYYYKVKAYNDFGDSSFSNEAWATTVISGTWLIVASRSAHNIALKTNNTIWGWGSNDWWQLGLGDNIKRTTPSQISTFIDWSVINVGAMHSLALKSTGTLWAWGENDYGQLGDNTTNIKTTPLQIGTDTDWHIIAGGNSHSIGIKTNYTIWAWGYNSAGQLGLGDIANRKTPTQIGTSSDWVIISLGMHTCSAIKTNGTLWTWGSNNYGQLGLGDTINRKTPTQIGIDSDWSRIFTGNTFHTFAFKTNQLMWAWGVNDYGQLGDGTTINRITPIQVGMDSDWSVISVGGTHTIGLKTNATLWAWGHNNYGQLGDGTTTGRTTPGNIGTDSDWSKPASGGNHSMGIKLNYTLWIWGLNYYGQLGLGDTIDRWTPTMIGE
jgi:alpha-tubulin suppressor-like RCC1 family protein